LLKHLGNDLRQVLTPAVAEPFCRLASASFGQGLYYAFLAREIEVYGAGTKLGLAADVVHRSPVKTATRETMKRGLQDLAAAAGAVGGAHFWHTKRIFVLFYGVVKPMESRPPDARQAQS
jgi:hypothetical protein